MLKGLVVSVCDRNYRSSSESNLCGLVLKTRSGPLNRRHGKTGHCLASACLGEKVWIIVAGVICVACSIKCPQDVLYRQGMTMGALRTAGTR